MGSVSAVVKESFTALAFMFPARSDTELPGIKSPTIIPLADEEWCSIHTVLDEKRFWEIIGKLKELGAQGILVTPIEKMIL